MNTKQGLSLALMVAGAVACTTSHRAAPSPDTSSGPSPTAGAAGQGGPAGSAGRNSAAPTAGSSASNQSAGSNADPCEPREPRIPCPDIDLDSAIVFSPVYSAYDGLHIFQVPVTLKGYVGATWQTDSDLVSLQQVNENTVMITTHGAGTVKIIVRAGPFSGSTTLRISEFQPDEVEIGEAIYYGAVMPQIDRNAAPVAFPSELSCKNCHHNTTELISVEFTPQQTGGYSDEELLRIVTMGMKPPRTGWRSGLPMSIYTMVHTLKLTEAEQRGLVAYMRALTPRTHGEIDFGGL